MRHDKGADREAGRRSEPGAAARRRAVAALFAAVLGALLLHRAFEPWRYANDDNGAFYSAVARAHLQAGLRETRGQDFFVSRETGGLVPYLHHPPLPGLILAAAFGIAGSDAPGVARLTFALLHLATFALVAALAARAVDPARKPWIHALALAVAATAPMSAYYGKMPNHEVPGLLFLLAGVLAWGYRPGAVQRRRAVLAGALWAGAVLSSWHAALCVLGWLAVQREPGRRRAALASAVWILAVLALAVAHLLWAGGWAPLESQADSARHWFAGTDGTAPGERIGFLRHAFGVWAWRFAYLPAFLALAWIALRLRDRILLGRRPDPPEAYLPGLALGSAAYYLLFPRAVADHAYQGFYTIPFVALAAALAVDRALALPAFERRPRVLRWIPAAALALTCLLGVTVTLRMYRRPSPRVMQVVETLAREYR